MNPARQKGTSMGNLAGMVAAFLLVRALFSISKYRNPDTGKIDFARFFKDKTFVEFGISLAVLLGLTFLYDPSDFFRSLWKMVFGGGAFAGGLVGFFTYGSKALKKSSKDKKNAEQTAAWSGFGTDTRTQSQFGGGDGVNENVAKIRRLRISIQDEIREKKQEARRMMDDPYLREPAKSKILERYSDCIRLLQELYAEASNVLAYFETNGSNFRFDADSLYVSLDKVNDLQTEIDKLKAFRKLSTNGGEDDLDDLMKKYDQDLEKLKKDTLQEQGRRQASQGRMPL